MFFNQPGLSPESAAPVPAQQGLAVLQQLLQSLGVPVDLLTQVLTGQLVPASQLAEAQARIQELEATLSRVQCNLTNCYDRLERGIVRPPCF